MNEAIMKKWVKALKSGNYKQTVNTLCSIDEKDQKRYCCLGVLTDLYVKDKASKKKKIGLKLKKPSYTSSGLPEGQKEIWSVNGESGLLPRAVALWAGFNLKNPGWACGQYKKSEDACLGKTLSNLNDGCPIMKTGKKSFKQIASVIEKNWNNI